MKHRTIKGILVALAFALAVSGGRFIQKKFSAWAGKGSDYIESIFASTSQKVDPHTLKQDGGHFIDNQFDQNVGVHGGRLATQSSRAYRAWPDEEKAESFCVDSGVRDERVVSRYPDGRVDEGCLVDGKRHGFWVERYPDGDVYEGNFIDGEQHGLWIERDVNGDVRVICYENDSRVDC